MCHELGLQASLLDNLKILERKYVVSHLLFRKYEKLFTIGPEGENKLDVQHFGWLLFLVAKDRLLTDVIPDLIQALNVLICSLSLTFFNWTSDPGIGALSRACGIDVERVLILRRTLFDSLLFSLVQTGILRGQVLSSSPEEGLRVKSMLTEENKKFNMESLRREYLRNSSLTFDETLLLHTLGKTQGDATPARRLTGASSLHFFDPPHPKEHVTFAQPFTPPWGTPSSAAVPPSPLTGLVKSVTWVETLARKYSPGPSAGLMRFFQSCPEEHFKNVQNVLASVRENLKTAEVTEWNKRFAYVTSIYYLLLETLLRAEEQRLGATHGGNFSVLLANERFHRSLLWCATEIVFYSYRTDRAFYPSNMSLVGVTPLDLIKVIESVVRFVKELSSVIVRRLSDVEENLLETFAWSSSSELFTALNDPGVKDTIMEWLGSESVQVAAANSFASPSRVVSKGTSNVSFGTKLFFKKMVVLCSHRVEQLCTALGLNTLVQSQVCKTFLHCAVKTMLCFDRHIDQILLCCVYAVGKVYFRAVGPSVAQEISFKEVISQYKNLPHYQRLGHYVFRDVLMGNGKKGSIIEFYNQVFITEMDEYVLKFQSEYGHNVAAVTPRTMHVHEMAPEATPAVTYRNVSVSPLKPYSAISPALHTARINAGRSPKKDLSVINAAIKGGAPRRPAVDSRKRLFPGQEEDDENDEDMDDDDVDDDEDFDDDDDEDDVDEEEGDEGLRNLLSVGRQELEADEKSNPKVSTKREKRE